MAKELKDVKKGKSVKNGFISKLKSSEDFTLHYSLFFFVLIVIIKALEIWYIKYFSDNPWNAFLAKNLHGEQVQLIVGLLAILDIVVASKVFKNMKVLEILIACAISVYSVNSNLEIYTDIVATVVKSMWMPYTFIVFVHFAKRIITEVYIEPNRERYDAKVEQIRELEKNNTKVN